jgi:hypothetical protein
VWNFTDSKRPCGEILGVGANLHLRSLTGLWFYAPHNRQAEAMNSNILHVRLSRTSMRIFNRNTGCFISLLLLFWRNCKDYSLASSVISEWGKCPRDWLKYSLLDIVISVYGSVGKTLKPREKSTFLILPSYNFRNILYNYYEGWRGWADLSPGNHSFSIRLKQPWK